MPPHRLLATIIGNENTKVIQYGKEQKLNSTLDVDIANNVRQNRTKRYWQRRRVEKDVQ